MVGKRENELCILLSYTGCTEGNTKALTDNTYCGQHLNFIWRSLRLSGHQVIILIYDYHVKNEIFLD